jgi:hypothetical protein
MNLFATCEYEIREGAGYWEVWETTENVWVMTFSQREAAQKFIDWRQT